ncbi:MAG: metallophosphoesterase [Clostridia bacterium]
MSEKVKKEKKILTPEQKKARSKKQGKIAGIVILALVLVFGMFIGTFAVINVSGFKSLIETANSFDTIDYEGKQLKPTMDPDGYWTFNTNRTLKIVQLTDIHIGVGFASLKSDSMALNAIAAMVSAEKPDLVVATGDIAYPVPVQAGTFNNLTAAEVFANLMEKLGVYWTFTFGNHDTESYSMYDREDICNFYANKIDSGEYKYCLFQRGPKDIFGYGNSIIKVKNGATYTQAIVTIDSNAYLPGDSFGIAWDYDNIHEDQVKWYEDEMLKLKAANGGTAVKSLAFFHIPLVEMREAYAVVREQGLNSQNTIYKDKNGKETIFNYGEIHEKDPYVYCGKGEDTFFETGKRVGLQGTFTGHDHFNNLSVTVDGIRMTYGKSIDYLAYFGISKKGAQRGCTVISVDPNGTFDCVAENYYQAKYPSKYPKEKVTFAW